jgi:hypothetical protein
VVEGNVVDALDVGLQHVLVAELPRASLDGADEGSRALVFAFDVKVQAALARKDASASFIAALKQLGFRVGLDGANEHAPLLLFVGNDGAHLVVLPSSGEHRLSSLRPAVVKHNVAVQRTLVLERLPAAISVALMPLHQRLVNVVQLRMDHEIPFLFVAFPAPLKGAPKFLAFPVLIGVIVDHARHLDLSKVHSLLRLLILISGFSEV